MLIGERGLTISAEVKHPSTSQSSQNWAGFRLGFLGSLTLKRTEYASKIEQQCFWYEI